MSKSGNLRTSNKMYFFFASSDVDMSLSLQVRWGFWGIKPMILLLPIAHGNELLPCLQLLSHKREIQLLGCPGCKEAQPSPCSDSHCSGEGPELSSLQAAASCNASDLLVSNLFPIFISYLHFPLPYTFLFLAVP